jgi:glycerophosphoryl diester phosphodiesterase
MSASSRELAIVAHRGGAGLAPENTLAACARALALGVDALEVDVRLTADGVPVLLHDATLDRTTDGRGPVADWSAAALRGLDATAQHAGAGVRSEPPPPLADALALAHGRAELYVELKGDPAVPPGLVAAVLALLEAPAPVVLISFDWGALALARHLAPGVRLGAIAGTWPAGGRLALERLRAAGVEWLVLRHSALTPRRRALVRASGLRLGVWTVNTAPTMRRARALGVDAITTDRPDRLLAVLASAG